MGRGIWFAFVTLIVARPAWGQSRSPTSPDEPNVAIQRFVQKFCVDCHGEKKPAGEFSILSLPTDAKTAADLAKWKTVFEQLESSAMPPDDAAQPSFDERQTIMDAIRRSLKAANAPVDESRARAAGRGNWVDHAALFSGKAQGDAATPSRVWRIHDETYEAFIKRLSAHSSSRLTDIKPPWRLSTQWSFSDYSSAHRVGEPEIEVHLRSTTRIAKHLLSLLPRNKQYAPLLEIVKQGEAANPDQIQAAVAFAFRFLLDRQPDAVESQRYAKFLTDGVKKSGGEQGLEQFLVVVMSHPSVLYRIEKPSDDVVRGLPAPHELARMISLTLTDREPDAALAEAARMGKLNSRDEVRDHVRRILTDESIAKPRIVRFFREYFGYGSAPDVFKDMATLEAHGIKVRSDWQPTFFVTDADQLVAWVVARDRDVLKELLTTNKTFVLTHDPRNSTTAASYLHTRFAKQPPDAPFKRGTGIHGTLAIYEIDFQTRGDWSPDKPYELPPEKRMGILTHPAWLVAQSGNFDNHAIHRGRWIRERLLGGRIPDVPITVNAMLPEEPHRTLRDRMRVVREEYCWKCHKQMDPLGLPFEQYDHFGRYRTAEMVLDLEATNAKSNLGKDGSPRRKLYKQVPLDTTGNIEGSLDPQLNGPVANPFELIRKLVDSELVEQVFVRHAFRFFLGRNEALADGPVLMAAHRAYRDNHGSMQSLLTSLLTSDAFLYRISPTETNAAASR